MANRNQTKLEWSEVPASLRMDPKTPIGKAWKALSDARNQAQELVKGPQAQFERVVADTLAKSGKVPDGMEVKFAYNFGKAATALAVREGKADKGGGLW